MQRRTVRIGEYARGMGISYVMVDMVFVAQHGEKKPRLGVYDPSQVGEQDIGGFLTKTDIQAVYAIYAWTV